MKLLLPICHQLLLQGKQETLAQDVKDAANIEYALNFTRETNDNQEVNIVHNKPSTQESSEHTKLQDSLDQIVKHFEALEMGQKQQPSLPPTQYADRAHRKQPIHGQHQQGRQHEYREPVCWLCGEVGHIQCHCPLNFNRPARRVGGWL